MPPPNRLTHAERLILADLQREAALARGKGFPYPAAEKADALGVSTVTLSRALRRFRDFGFVKGPRGTGPGRVTHIEYVTVETEAVA